MERKRRYPSDLTDAQWEIVEPMLTLIKSPGRIPKHPRRAIVDAILYVVRSGCSWRGDTRTTAERSQELRFNSDEHARQRDAIRITI
jgi:transposase